MIRTTNKYLRSIYYIHTYNNIKNIINEYKYKAYSYNNMPGILL